MQSDDDRVVPTEELTAADRSALAWAVSTGHPVGTLIVARVRSGRPGVRAAELAAIGDDWDNAGRPVPDHHVHRTAVSFPPDAVVTGVTFSEDDPYRRETVPAFGLYLDERWSPPWPHAHVPWPDFGVPTDTDLLRDQLQQLLERAQRGESVEIGCLGGHGRTGTALACLAVLTGTPAADAVDWVRANYCNKAVETEEQEALVRSFSP